MTPIQQALYKYWDALRLQVFILFHLRDVRERLQTMEPMEPDTKDTSTTRHFRFPVEYEISTPPPHHQCTAAFARKIILRMLYVERNTRLWGSTGRLCCAHAK